VTASSRGSDPPPPRPPLRPPREALAAHPAQSPALGAPDCLLVHLTAQASYRPRAPSLLRIRCDVREMWHTVSPGPTTKPEERRLPMGQRFGFCSHIDAALPRIGYSLIQSRVVIQSKPGSSPGALNARPACHHEYRTHRFARNRQCRASSSLCTGIGSSRWGSPSAARKPSRATPRCHTTPRTVPCLPELPQYLQCCVQRSIWKGSVGSGRCYG
jgi:hypothetical protein